MNINNKMKQQKTIVTKYNRMIIKRQRIRFINNLILINYLSIYILKVDTK